MVVLACDNYFIPRCTHLNGNVELVRTLRLIRGVLEDVYSAFFPGASRGVTCQFRMFLDCGLDERLCLRERFLCVSEVVNMLGNEGVYVAERRSACSDCFLNLFDGIFRSCFFRAFYCFA